MLAHPEFAFSERDLLDDGLDELIEGAAVVFHLAARPGVRDSWHDFDDYVRSNILGTKALFDACAGRDRSSTPRRRASTAMPRCFRCGGGAHRADLAVWRDEGR